MNKFRSFSNITILFTYLLIFIGGLVRVSGAGMGCPDWPKCFDRWIPPTNVDQLPDHIDPALFNIVLAWIEYCNRLFGVFVGLFITITFLLINNLVIFLSINFFISKIIIIFLLILGKAQQNYKVCDLYLIDELIFYPKRQLHLLMNQVRQKYIFL